MAGAGTLGRLTPFELQLLHLAVSYQFNPSVPILDDTSAVGSFAAHLGGSLPVIGGVNVNISGTSDTPHGTIIDGTQSVKLFGYSGTNEVLINNTILADCITLSNGYQSGFRIDFSGNTAPSPSCNMSGLTRPNLPPSATGSSARLSGRAPVKLRLPAGLRDVMLQVTGTRAAPRFRITGPGVAARTPRGGKPDFTRHALFFTDVTGKRSYVSLDSPRPGTYTIAPLPGSSPIKSVMQSVPLPKPKLTAKVERAGCSDRLDYRLQCAGTKILLLTRVGTRFDLISSPHSGHGELSIPLSPATGRGRVIAYYLRGTSPAGTAVVATFRGASTRRSQRTRHGSH